jgi:hypothetical protein
MPTGLAVPGQRDAVGLECLSIIQAWICRSFSFCVGAQAGDFYLTSAAGRDPSPAQQSPVTFFMSKVP